MPLQQRRRAQGRRGAVVAAVLVVVVALNLRAAIVAVPPVLDQVRQATGLSLTAAGLLTTLPVLCFSLVAPVAGWLGSRYRLEAVLAAAMLALALGAVARSYTGTPGLLAGSLVVGAAITVGNVLVPGLVKRDFPASGSTMTAVYVTALTGGAAVAAGLSIPLASWPVLGWHGALSIWALPAVATAVLLVVRARGRARANPAGRAAHSRSDGPASVNVRRSPIAWLITGYTTLQSLLFYAGLTWLPTILVDQGVPRREAVLALVLYTIVGVPASLLVPLLARGMEQRVPLAVPGLLWVVGLAGLGSRPDQWLIWTLVLAVGHGAGLSVGLSQVVLRAGNTAVATRLSAMSQFTGYLVTAAGSWAAGATADTFGGWTVPMAGLTALAVAMIGFGLIVGRPTARVCAGTPLPERATPTRPEALGPLP